MTDQVLFSTEGQLGLITLNRPDALNALTLAMILAIQKQLSAWKTDNAIQAVVIRAKPGNAFCAGGDVRWLYATGRAQDPEQLSFFWHEYRLNHFIHHFGKPYIALMNGMTMGGGVGVALHGSYPIASEEFVFAMPETSIGFFPDIGASYLLNRCPGSLGIYLGLTGNRLGPEDAMKAGLVKQLIPADQMSAFVKDLASRDLSGNAHAVVEACIDSFAAPTSEYSTQIKPLIDVCFAPPTVELIKASLQTAEGPWAMGVDNALDKKAPLSLKITLAQLQKTKGLSLGDCLKMDYDLVRHFMRGTDFYEGVRALLIDKDKNPIWNPQTLALVSDEQVVNYFERADKGLEFIEK